MGGRLQDARREILGKIAGRLHKAKQEGDAEASPLLMLVALSLPFCRLSIIDCVENGAGCQDYGLGAVQGDGKDG